jgi:hypothetical protein
VNTGKRSLSSRLRNPSPRSWRLESMMLRVSWLLLMYSLKSPWQCYDGPCSGLGLPRAVLRLRLVGCLAHVGAAGPPSCLVHPQTVERPGASAGGKLVDLMVVVASLAVIVPSRIGSASRCMTSLRSNACAP